MGVEGDAKMSRKTSVHPIITVLGYSGQNMYEFYVNKMPLY